MRRSRVLGPLTPATGTQLDIEMTHQYKHVLQAIIDGHTIQWQHQDGTWIDQIYAEVLSDLAKWVYHPHRYRVKTKTITIGTFEVPEPVREPLERGQGYYLADTASDDGVTKWYWDGGDTDNIWLKRGLIHLDEGAAHLHAEALLSFTKGN